jgi:hypothetical protein
MLKIVLVALAWVALAESYSFNQSEFHVSYAMKFFETTDYFHLTGQLTEHGGTVSAQCANDTAARKCSHSIEFGQEYNFAGHVQRNVGASIGGRSVSGVAIFYEKWSEWVVQYREAYPMAILNPGPNPPPKCTTKCEDMFTQTSCESTNHTWCESTCTWCKQDPRIGGHPQCFWKDWIPERKGWSCDRATLAAFV